MKQTRDEYIEQTIQALMSGDIDGDYLRSMDDLSLVEKKYISAEFLKRAEASMEKTMECPTDEWLDPIHQTDSPILTWGTEESDKVLSPVEPHHYCVVAGAQASGKTAWTFNLAEKNSDKHVVAYYSLEMSRIDIISRACRERAGITKEEWRDKNRIPKGKKALYLKRRDELTNKENLNLVGLAEWNTRTIEAIIVDIRKLQPSLVFIDNLDLIERSSQAMGDLEHQQHVSRTLLDFTNSDKIPVILIHHQNKSKESGIRALRGSGKISDDADMVLMCNRPSNEDSDLSREERAKFIVRQVKDRAFGDTAVKTFYFNKGDFIDKFEGYSNPFSE